jgi:hypothetical protein
LISYNQPVLRLLGFGKEQQAVRAELRLLLLILPMVRLALALWLDILGSLLPVHLTTPL